MRLWCSGSCCCDYLFLISAQLLIGPGLVTTPADYSADELLGFLRRLDYQFYADASYIYGSVKATIFELVLITNIYQALILTFQG